MTARQPEIGSALGLTTAEVVARCDDHMKRLLDVRADLVSALGSALAALNGGEPPIDITIRLYRTTEGMLERWQH